MVLEPKKRETIWFSTEKSFGNAREGLYVTGWFCLENNKIRWCSSKVLSKMILGLKKTTALKKLMQIRGFAITHTCDFDYEMRSSKRLKELQNEQTE